MVVKTQNEAFLDLLKRGDRTAGEKFIRDNQENVFGLAFRMTGNRDDALDITQETFVKALDNIKKFRGDAMLSTWLYAIAANVSRDFLRRSSRATFVEIDDNIISADSRSALADLEEKDDRRLVREAMLSLSPKMRAVFVLRFEKGLPIAEIAKALKKSEGTVKAQIHEGVKKIRAIVEAHNG
ncbi:MAG TPA: RNA polymerase sigma factor [candidate division Zixibacteria bacterium]|nr:RNA polymerase sigma factor [candidate division Zixibacteria bacterium]